MAEDAPKDDEPKQKKGKLPLILGIVGALLLGGGGFYATYSGMILGHSEPEKAPEAEIAAAPAFVAIDPIIISLDPNASARHLRFASQIEVEEGYQAEVTQMLPRIVDVLNGYLRAVETRDLENPAALVRLKAQMLRRIQIVTGEGRVRDLLVSEFVLN
jgi:flagellar FliL protein